MGNQQSRTCCLPFPVGRLRLFTPTAYNLLNHPVQNRLYPHQLHVTLWHANNLSFVPFGWLSMATTLFWSFLKEKNCLQRVPWTVRIWIPTLVFNIAYAGASIITLTTCPNSLSPFSTFQRMADGTFWGHVVQIEPGDWKWTDTDSGRSFTRSLRTSFSLGWLEHCKCGTRFGPHFHEQSATRLKS